MSQNDIHPTATKKDSFGITRVVHENKCGDALFVPLFQGKLSYLCRFFKVFLLICAAFSKFKPVFKGSNRS